MSTFLKLITIALLGYILIAVGAKEVETVGSRQGVAIRKLREATIQAPYVHQQIRSMMSSNETCFAEESLMTCGEGYQPQRGSSRIVNFLCCRKDSNVVTEISTKLKSNNFVDLTQPRYAMVGNRRALSVEVNPINCKLE